MQKLSRLFLSALFCLFLTGSFAQSRLKIEITGLRSSEGEICLELFGADNQLLKSKTATIKDNKCTVVIENLENAEYAVRYIHDENSNGELDTNWIGIPKEGYGFSNDAYGIFGPKDFKAWLFVVNGNTEITLKTGY